MSDNLPDSILNVKKLMERKASGDMEPLMKAYKDSLDRVQGQLSQITSRYTEGGELSISDAQRYSALQDLEEQIAEQTNQLGELDVEISERTLKRSYSEGYYRTAYHLERGMSGGGSFGLLRPEMVEQAVNMPIEGKMFSDRIWDNKDKLIERTRGLLERSMVDGADPAKLARELTKQFNTSAYESARLVQNEVARCTREAADSMYKNSNVVNELMFDSTLDSDTSDTCRELDGTRYSIDEIDTKPQIPSDTHVGCRSDYIPVVDGWEPTTKRDNESGETIDYESYPKWKESKGISDEVDDDE
ncbi:phage head morphogenesis protein [Salsuginibacillus kocurii]|uniref:phage head morphogenesis protein n=1 Tax=Salsuginibacillus kocurii TaxID=427078 RepID=UPI0003806AF1|nr:phage head morphogenesis protein [Salsuginibacillus kocurii]